MAKKNTPRSIDGFVPQHGVTPRLVGFDVVKKPAMPTPKPPKQLRRQAESFPAIGQTLATYHPTAASVLPAAPGLTPRPAPSPFNLDDIEDAPSKEKKRAKGKGRARWSRR